MKFENPQIVLIGFSLLLLFGLFQWFMRRFNKDSSYKFSNPIFKKIDSGFLSSLSALPNVLRYATIAAIILAISGPYFPSENEKVNKEGIDIVIALDVSQSMTAIDLSPNRLERAKSSIASFINSRPNDRIALVVFGRDAYLQCPLTFDHSMLFYFLRQRLVDESVTQSTAIGTAITTSMVALKNANKRNQNQINSKGDKSSRIIILVTDGENTSGEIDPITAAELAESLGIKIYTIGIGKSTQNQRRGQGRNTALYHSNTPFKAQFDEKMLQQISKISDGNYFNVQNDQQMKQTYEKIDALEKNKTEGESFFIRNTAHTGFIFAAFFLFILELLLKFSFLRKFPD